MIRENILKNRDFGTQNSYRERRISHAAGHNRTRYCSAIVTLIAAGIGGGVRSACRTDRK